MIGFLIYLNGILLADDDCTIDSSEHILTFPYQVRTGTSIQILEYVAGFLVRRIVFNIQSNYTPNERISYEAFLPTT